jgi:DsbC/DsbD-like thiol-disulfide interchange protein
MLFSVCASAQTLELRAPKPKSGVVSYVAEPLSIEAGKKADVPVIFRIADGLHINSHKPFTPGLVATILTLQPTQGVQIKDVEYPEGVKYAFALDPTTKLSVYTGSFQVKVIVATSQAGDFILNGELRYQACDNAQCYPVKTLPVAVPVTVK